MAGKRKKTPATCLRNKRNHGPVRASTHLKSPEYHNLSDNPDKVNEVLMHLQIYITTAAYVSESCASAVYCPHTGCYKYTARDQPSLLQQWGPQDLALAPDYIIRTRKKHFQIILQIQNLAWNWGTLPDTPALHSVCSWPYSGTGPEHIIYSIRNRPPTRLFWLLTSGSQAKALSSSHAEGYRLRYLFGAEQGS